LLIVQNYDIIVDGRAACAKATAGKTFDGFATIPHEAG